MPAATAAMVDTPAASTTAAPPTAAYGMRSPTVYAGSHSSHSSAAGMMRGSVGEETRMMTRAAPLARSRDHADAVLNRLNRLVGRHVPAISASRPPAQPR